LEPARGASELGFVWALFTWLDGETEREWRLCSSANA